MIRVDIDELIGTELEMKIPMLLIQAGLELPMKPNQIAAVVFYSIQDPKIFMLEEILMN